jgi:hypothetical protein
MLTVRELVADCGLELATGEAGADRKLRWVHISEHEDPTPWLSGGELVLTTGYQLATPAKQRRFVELLDECCRRRSSTPRPRKASRFSRCHTRCRSSRSRSAPPRAS